MGGLGNLKLHLLAFWHRLDKDISLSEAMQPFSQEELQQAFWLEAARHTIFQLPKEDRKPFVDWLDHNRDMLELYREGWVGSSSNILQAWKTWKTR